jgi:hypothetical protein
MMKRAAESLGNAYGSKGLSGRKLDFKDEDLNEGFNRAMDEGLLAFGSLDELVSPREIDSLMQTRMAAGKPGIDPVSLVKNSAHLYMHTAKSFYSLASGTGAKLGFLTNWELGKSRGLKGESLYQFAKQGVTATSFSGGRANRPFFFDQLGTNVQGPMGLLFTLNNFTFATLGQMGRLFKESLDTVQGVGGNRLTLAEKNAAKKAFATQMIVQFSLAGTMGMPFVGAAMRILENMFGIEVEQTMREGIQQLAGDDEELGFILQDLAMSGLPTSMSGAAAKVTGGAVPAISFESRLGLGGVLGINDYDGFNIAGFFGAAGGTVARLYEGVTEVAQGNFMDGIKTASPQAFRGALQMVADNGDIRSRSGELMMKPDMSEQIATVMGFKPTRVSKAREKLQALRRSEELVSEDRRRALSEVAEAMNTGQQSLAKDLYNQYLAENPTEDPDTVADSVALIAVQQTVPQDPLGHVPRAGEERAEAISGTFPTTDFGSEVQRRTLKTQVKSQLTGRFERPNPRQFIIDQLVDQIRAQNPNISRARALRIAQQQVGGRR